MIKNKVVKAISDISSSSVVPNLIAGLTVAAAAVKLLAAISEFKAIKSSTRKIGFSTEE